MKMKDRISLLSKSKSPFLDMISFFEGKVRYKLYYADATYCTYKIDGEHRKNPYMRQHIWEQIKYRIKVMNKDCFNSGACVKCGCETTALQMANKRCEGMCYPPMVSKDVWNIKANISDKIDGKHIIWVWQKPIGDRTDNFRYIPYIENLHNYTRYISANYEG